MRTHYNGMIEDPDCMITYDPIIAGIAVYKTAPNNPWQHGATATLDLTLGTELWLELDDDMAITFHDPIGCTVTRLFVYQATGEHGNIITWPAATRFPGGTVPTPTAALNGADLFEVYCDGTYYYVRAVAQDLNGTANLQLITLGPLVGGLIHVPNGGTVQIVATGTYADAHTADVTLLVDSWISATPANVSVDATGLLTFVDVGDSVITASIGDIDGVATAHGDAP
jgi:hypothetical protein